ncbi:MAG: hypothetical protein HYW05_05280 [Candidatus Diapherotrites archaeon]|nr:hypothetical protein [Candidatus Diapherotrites archaeon]
MNKAIAISVAASLALLVLFSGCVTPDDTDGRGKCGDGVCGPVEKKNPAICPQDCAEEPPDGTGAVKMNILLIVHSGEGPCEMSKATLTDSDYIRCRDGLKDVADELYELGIPATFELLGPFAELLSKDAGFSFDADIISKGHNIGFHGHSHCYYDGIGVPGAEGCENVDLQNNLFWGQIGLDQSPTMEELLARIGSAMLFNKYSDIGSMHGMAYQYRQDPDALISELDKRGIRIWTSTKAVSRDYPEDSLCNKAKTLLSPHPIIPAADYPNVVYFDHGPAKGDSDMPGDPKFRLDALTSRFGALLKCAQDEQSEIPYIFAMGTHLWNIITNEDNNEKEYDGITDIKSFRQWVNGNYRDEGAFRKIEDVYEDFTAGNK